MLAKNIVYITNKKCILIFLFRNGIANDVIERWVLVEEFFQDGEFHFRFRFLIFFRNFSQKEELTYWIQLQTLSRIICLNFFLPVVHLPQGGSPSQCFNSKMYELIIIMGLICWRPYWFKLEKKNEILKLGLLLIENQPSFTWWVVAHPKIWFTLLGGIFETF